MAAAVAGLIAVPRVLDALAVPSAPAIDPIVAQVYASDFGRMDQRSELAYQLAKRQSELRRDMERALSAPPERGWITYTSHGIRERY
jgi:hypothetical protein